MVSPAHSGALARSEGRDSTPREPATRPREWSAGQVLAPVVALPLLVGLGVRVALALAFAGTAAIGDEAAYANVAERWADSGAYGGQWAPGYPAVLASLTWLAGEAAPDVLRGVQALLGLVIGASVAQIAGAFGGRRAAAAAAWLHALYLPLAGFAALLFSETLFLALLAPSLALLATGGDRARDRFAAGALIGAALLVRESTLLLLPPLLLWVAWPRSGALRLAQVGRVAAIAAGAAAVVLPWVFADASAGGPPRPIARTAGANAFIGLNAHDINFDVALLPSGEAGRLRERLRGPAPPAWPDAAHEPAGATPSAQSPGNVTRALDYALAHPGFTARARTTELVDLLAPTCYLVRQMRAVEGIGAPLATPRSRRATALVASSSFPLLALVALLGAATLARREGAPRCPAEARLGWLAAAVVAGTCSVVLLNAVTRFRAPMLPVLMVLAALWLAHPAAPQPGLRRRSAVGAAVILGLLWLPSLGTSWAAIVAAGR